MTAQHCPTCGAETTQAAQFCAACGAQIIVNPPAAETPIGEPAKSSGRKVGVAAGRAFRAYDAGLKRRWPRGRWVVHGVTGLVLVGMIAAPFSNAKEPLTAADPSSSSSQAAAVTSPTPTPSPEPTPTPEATAEPTQAANVDPSPTPEATPDPAPELDFETIKKSGRGDKLVRFKIPEESLAIAKLTHTGSGNFAVWTVNADGEETDLLVNEIGRYQGKVMFDESGHSVAMSITASGNWTLTISPIQKISHWNGKETRKGTSDDVFMLTGKAADAFGAKFRHKGEGNFAVWAYGSNGADLLVNDIGSYTGEVVLDGAQIIELTADGRWSASLID